MHICFLYFGSKLYHRFSGKCIFDKTIIFALLLLHAAQLITERFFENDLGIELNNRYWLFIIASLLVCIITSIVIFMDKTVSSFSLSLVCGAFLLVNIIISYLMDDLVKSSQKALENQALRDQNENMEALRSFRHDMKRHFAEISVLASTGKIEQIKNYVSAMENNLVESRRLVDSGNTALDTVLNYMLQRAVDKKIQCNLNLSAYDMNIIFGNLLENAIEAQKDVKNPSIDLEINYLMDSLVVEISNRCLQKVIFKGGLPITTKQSVREHGYGIKNVKKVLDKYISTLDFECSDERFTVKILMKI